jgi:hypothetical protein
MIGMNLEQIHPMNKDLLNAILAGLLVLAIGILSGYSLGYYRGAQNRFPEILQISDVNPGVPTVNINGIQNGKIEGGVIGQKVRIVSGSDIQTVDPGKSFEIPVGTLVLAPKPSTVPSDTQWVASKRGKYYYSIFDARADGIASQNRLYFKSEADATKAGFKKPSATTP